MRAGWPSAPAVDRSFIEKNDYLKSVIKSLQQKLQLVTKPKKGTPLKATRAAVHVGKEFSEHQKLVLRIMRESVREGQLAPLKDLAPLLNKALPPEAKSRSKQLMQFMTGLVTEFNESGAHFFSHFFSFFYFFFSRFV